MNHLARSQAAYQLGMQAREKGIMINRDLTVTDLWAVHSKFQSNKLAVSCGPRKATWKEFNEGINRVANTLLDEGFQKGDRVSVLMKNSVDVLEIMFGIVKAGCTVVPLNAMLTTKQLEGMLIDSQSKKLFVSEDYQHLIPNTKETKSLLTTMKQKKMSNEGIILVKDNQNGEKKVNSNHKNNSVDAFQSYYEWIGKEIDEPVLNVPICNDDEFNIIYTSGTTGTPKGIIQTHRARQHWSFSNALEMRFDINSRALTTTSLYSNGTWLMVLPTLFVGGTLHVQPTFNPSEFLEIVQREKITHTFMVPVQFTRVMEQKSFQSADLSSLKTILSAGSLLRQDVKKQVLDKMGKGLFELYGCSEGLATMCRPEQHSLKPGSVGTPVVGFNIKILDPVDADKNGEVKFGEVGEIAGTGAGLMFTYNNRKEQTSEEMWIDPKTGETYFKTGDIGKLDDDGFLYILDRKKDMIISGGFNIFPKDIEEIISSHEAVKDVCVVGVPHSRWDEAPLAIVIPKQGMNITDRDIITFSNQRLSKAQRLAGAIIQSPTGYDFPRNVLGKVQKKDLRKPFWEKEYKRFWEDDNNQNKR